MFPNTTKIVVIGDICIDWLTLYSSHGRGPAQGLLPIDNFGRQISEWEIIMIKENI